MKPRKLTQEVMTLAAALSKLKLLTLLTPSATSVTTYLIWNSKYKIIKISLNGKINFTGQYTHKVILLEKVAP